jgi:predicted HAD superfamily Cof-like phosphohydrolase
MGDWSKNQADFMQAGGQALGEVDLNQAQRYLQHMQEEVLETNIAFGEMDFLKMVDGAIDTIVVAIGFLHSINVNPNLAWDAVHRANMRKVVNGKVYRRPDGQIGKPPGWYGPDDDLRKLL